MKIIITEKDRQAAEPYSSCHHCLVATALLRRGKRAIVGGYTLTIDEVTYRDSNKNLDSLHKLKLDSTEKPFYQPSVVGLQINLVPLYEKP